MLRNTFMFQPMIQLVSLVSGILDYFQFSISLFVCQSFTLYSLTVSVMTEIEASLMNGTHLYSKFWQQLKPWASAMS